MNGQRPTRTEFVEHAAANAGKPPFRGPVMPKPRRTIEAFFFADRQQQQNGTDRTNGTYGREAEQ